MKQCINVLLNVSLLFTTISPILADNTDNDRLVAKIRKVSFLTEKDPAIWVRPEILIHFCLGCKVIVSICGGGLLGRLVGQQVVTRLPNLNKVSGSIIEIASQVVGGIGGAALLMYAIGGSFDKYGQYGILKRIKIYMALCENFELAKNDFNATNLSEQEKIDQLERALNNSEKNYNLLLSDDNSEYIAITKALDELYAQGAYARQLVEKLKNPSLFEKPFFPNLVQDEIIVEYMENIRSNKNLIAAKYKEQLSQQNKNNLKQREVSAREKSADAQATVSRLSVAAWSEKMVDKYAPGLIAAAIFSASCGVIMLYAKAKAAIF